MHWEEVYQSRLTTAENAVQVIRSNQRVFMTGNSSVPRQLLSALVQYAKNCSNIELCQPLTITNLDYLSDDLRDHLRVNTLFISPNVRKAVNQGNADFTPVLLSQLPLLFKNKILSVDVALLHLSPPNSEGYCSLGLETGLLKTISESASILIAEANPNMPTIFGEGQIHVSQIHHIVPVNYPLTEVPIPSVMDDSTRQIAHFVAELIPDGATLQLGIGEIPNAILAQLSGKRDLGIHAELVSDGIIDLVEKGVITGKQKSLHPGKIIAGFGFGTRRLHRWLDKNPGVELRRTEYVNHPFTIAQNRKMVAVNSAIEIDLTGQVCADSIGSQLFSGVGGQLDFIYGASLSEEGIPIIVLPSITSSSNRQSRIVSTLKTGAGVTTTRNHIHYVVTEYGAVNLYGKSIRDRANLLISIAHPDVRELLTYDARKLNYL